MDVQLCNSVITGKLLQSLLSQSSALHVNGHHLIGVEAKVIGEGQGFTSRILRVSLKWSTNQPTNGLPSSVIVKMIGDGAIEDMMSHMSKEEMARLNNHLLHAHNIECNVYDFDDLRTMVPMPICYAKIKSTDKKPGIILFEDMGGRGVVKTMSTWGFGLTDGQLESLLDTLASIHAWSVNNTEWREVIPSLTEFNVMEPLLESLVSAFPESKKKYPEVLKDLDERKVKELLTNEKYMELFACDPKREYNLPLVLVHGDVHVMNMMFEPREDGTTPGDKLVAMLDWQISHQGCAVEDLTRVFILCLSTKQRRENGDEILRRYVELFNSKVCDPTNRITFEDIKRALDRMYAYTGVMWACGLSMFEKASEHMKDITEEQKRKSVTEGIIAYIAEGYYDALEMLIGK